MIQNTSSTIFTSSRFFLALVMAVTVLAGCGKKERTPETVIAKVGNETVAYSAISVDSEALKAEAGENATEEQLKDLRLKMESDNLDSALRKAVYNAKVQELGIAATDEEVSANFDAEVALAGVTDQSVADMKKRAELIYEGIKAYAADPSQNEIIYKNKMAALFSKTEWEIYTSIYDEKKDAERFKPDPNMPSSLAEAKAMMTEEIRKKLVTHKFRTQVFPQVVIEDAKVREFYDSTVNGKQNPPPFEAVSHAIPVFLMEMKFFEECRTCMKDWEDSEIKSDKVVIKDEEFRLLVKGQ